MKNIATALVKAQQAFGPALTLTFAAVTLTSPLASRQ